MNPFYTQTGVDWIGVVVSRQEVESLDISQALKMLQSVLHDAETVRMFQGQVGISFHGYDTDSRELYQIPEVRRYVALLDSKFPFWFYFLSTDHDTLKMIAFCLCSTKEVDSGLACVDPAEIEPFLIRHFDALNYLFAHYGLDEAINEEISALVLDCFSPKQPETH
jgi:hypothetical protein